MGISLATYSLAAAAYLFLLVLLLQGWRGRMQGVLLSGAVLATAAWAAAVAYAAARPGQGILTEQLLELLRSILWCCFLLVLLGYAHQSVQALRRTALVFAACGALLVSGTIYSSASGGPGLFGPLGIICLLGLSVAGMVLVEQLYRNIKPEQRWGIKYLCLGLGGMFVFDFYLYSDALLFRRINEDIWAARGVIDSLVVPLIAVSVSRNPRWSLDVSVSRRVLFQSSAIMGSAIYLLVMAAVGYYIRYFGGSWGGVLQTTFLFGALQLLLVILFSGTLRARLRVFLSKNFFSYRYDYREEWLRFTLALSEGETGVQLRERSIRAIADLVDSPAGALWLVQEGGPYERVAHWNMPLAAGAEPRDGPFVRFLEKRQWVIDLDEFERSPDYEGLKSPAWLASIPRAWLVVPLAHHDQILGFVVLAKSLSNLTLNWEVCDLLKTAGRQSASYLAQLEAANALLVARQFESFNRMSAFVVHDLKNLVAQLSLVLSNSQKHRHNPEFQDDMLETVSNSVEKMTRLLIQLRGGYSLEPPAPVLLKEMLASLVDARSRSVPTVSLHCHAVGLSVIAHRARLERVTGHLIQNAVEATPVDGRVAVGLERAGDSAVVTISDTGAGMTDEFMNYHLFKPFESTKPAGMGIGTYEAHQYLRELGGRIDVHSRPGEGTVFRLTLPLGESSNAAAFETASEGSA